MHRRILIPIILATAIACAAPFTAAQAQTGAPAEVKTQTAAPDRTLHVIATAHLDTQWRWTIQTTIDEYIKNTLHDNFRLFEKYPEYRFSFEGAFRYELMKEYYPADFERVRGYVGTGQWNVTGSSYDAGDVNIPSPESVFRHVLYGNGFFKKEFGKSSVDIYLPDCFGFGYALPTIERHAGLSAFSTQKLTWGSFIGVPFDIGMWEGVDGSQVVATVNPGDYGAEIREDLSTNQDWLKVIDSLGHMSGFYRGYKYFGTGDIGGSPDSLSVDWLVKSMHGKGPIKVVSAPADALARTVTPEVAAKMPHYKGELVMSTHGTGCYTAQAAMKVWNRKNELSGDAAERASVIANWAGGVPYPAARLTADWKRFLWHQFHDDLTGTSIAEAYTFSWNDELLSLKDFSSITNTAIGSLATGLKTNVPGVPVVVYNPLSQAREDLVEGTFTFPGAAPKAVKVTDAEGKEVPSQIVSTEGNTAHVVFLAQVAPVGARVYSVQTVAKASAPATGLSVTKSSLENEYYRVTIDAAGNVATIFDKKAQREVLGAPQRLDLLANKSVKWPAWEIMPNTVAVPPRASVGGPATIAIVENGPAAVALEITRTLDGSVFVQKVRLAAGRAGEQVVFANTVRWNTKKTLLKATFPLAVQNEKAVYDLGIGVIERGNNTEKLYEVPAQQWAGMDAKDGSYGVAIMNDSRYGWDKPDNSTLRLTLVHTPETDTRYDDQSVLDLGTHHVTYAVYGHKGTWQDGKVAWQAARLNQPLQAFQTNAHAGVLGSEFSMLATNTDAVMVTAVKQAEGTDHVVIRMRNLTSTPQNNVTVTLPSGIVSASEWNASEEPLGTAAFNGATLKVGTISAYSPKTFAVRLAAPAFALGKPAAQTVALPFDGDGMSLDDNRADGDLDGQGHTIPGELVPSMLEIGGVRFAPGSGAPGAKNFLHAKGNTIRLPDGTFDHVYLLAAATEDAQVTLKLGTVPHTTVIPRWIGLTGQWDSPLLNGKAMTLGRINGSPLESPFFTPAFTKSQQAAFIATHTHDAKANRNLAYINGTMYLVKLPMKPGTKTLTLPNDPRVRVFAVSVAKDPLQSTQPTATLREIAPVVVIGTPSGSTAFSDALTFTLASSNGTGTIRFTLDGAEPTLASPVYTYPVRIAKSANVKAAVFGKAGRIGEVSSGTFVKAEYMPLTKDKPGAQGLRCDYFEGTWSQVPDFASMTSLRWTVVPRFEYPTHHIEDKWGARYSGFITVPKDGIYTFFVNADDGAKLFIGSAEIVDNGGTHSAREASGAVALRAGTYPIAVAYFDRGYEDILEVRVSGPDMEKQIVPTSMLTH
jgi:alpha-mannosidase